MITEPNPITGGNFQQIGAFTSMFIPGRSQTLTLGK